MHKHAVNMAWCTKHEQWEVVPTTVQLLTMIKQLQKRIEKLESASGHPSD